MRPVELKLYRDNFNVLPNHGCLNRILRSIIVTLLAVGFIRLIPVSQELGTVLLIVILLGGIFIADKYIRRIYPDWPKSKNFIGTIHFSKDLITIKKENKVIELPLTECVELLLFIDHYSGFEGNRRDIERNGNGLLFYKNNQGESSIYKFNIFNEKQYDEFKNLITFYKENIPYFKEYLPYEITHILISDLSDRIIYH